jgi:hypothetical protein
MNAVIKCVIVVTAVVAWALPAEAQQTCEPVDIGESTFKTPEICGFVWTDTNRNGFQDDDPDMDSSNGDQSGITDAQVTLLMWDTMNNEWDPVPVGDTFTDGGFYYFVDVEDGMYKVVVSVPSGQELSPEGAGGDETKDSDGVNDNKGSATVVTIGTGGVASQDFDFGFRTPTQVAPPPGTGTPGYWKNHVWPVSFIDIGGIPYTREQALSYMGKVSKDKTITLFSSLLAAKLNIEMGNPHGCIDVTIGTADTWMGTHLPGSGVMASSADWQEIADEHEALDDYNNGRLCAPHRN